MENSLKKLFATRSDGDLELVERKLEKAHITPTQFDFVASNRAFEREMTQLALDMVSTDESLRAKAQKRLDEMPRGKRIIGSAMVVRAIKLIEADEYFE